MSASIKSTWWSVTAYNDEIGLMQDVSKYPSVVKQILGGLEECPKTKTIHFQGALQCHRQVRMSQLKEWLPTAHLEPATNSIALSKYAMKPETSIGEKKILINSKKFYSADNILQMIASEPAVQASYKGQTDRQTDSLKRFWIGVRSILTKSPELAGQLMNPSLKSFWVSTEPVWINHSITGLSDPIYSCNGCGRDECIECSERENIVCTEYNNGEAPCTEGATKADYEEGQSDGYEES